MKEFPVVGVSSVCCSDVRKSCGGMPSPPPSHGEKRSDGKMLTFIRESTRPFLAFLPDNTLDF